MMEGERGEERKGGRRERGERREVGALGGERAARMRITTATENRGGCAYEQN